MGLRPKTLSFKTSLSYSYLILVRLNRSNRYHYNDLSGNTPIEGFIEIKGSNGIWGGICDDSWDKPDADVVCRMLGYPSSETVYNASKPFGHGKGDDFVLDNVVCVGTEVSVFDCPHIGARFHDCKDNEWAGVKCETWSRNSK